MHKREEKEDEEEKSGVWAMSVNMHLCGSGQNTSVQKSKLLVTTVETWKPGLGTSTDLTDQEFFFGLFFISFHFQALSWTFSQGASGVNARRCHKSHWSGKSGTVNDKFI